MNTKGSDQRSYLVESIPFLFLLFLLIVEWIFAPRQVTLSSFFLFGVWVADLRLKSLLGFGKETSFADLNLAAVVFVASRFVDLIGDAYNSQNSTSLLEIAQIIFLLAFCWVINLGICRDISSQNNDMQGWFSWFVSGLLSFGCVIWVIFLQEWGII